MLTKDQEKLITMLIEGHKITDIAKKIGVSRQTIYSWKDNAEFKAELDRRRQDIVNQANACVLKDVSIFLDEIKKIALECPDQRVKFSACRYVVDRVLGAPRAIEAEDADIGNSVNESELEAELKKFKLIKGNA